MKEQFAGFYGPSENEIDEAYKDPKTMFIFDTNILLSLYRCEETTRTQFLDVWRNLKDQVWIPFHVCLEYQRNRLIVIQSARDSLKEVNKNLCNKIDKMFSELNPDTLSRYSNLRDELNNLKSLLKENLNSFVTDKLEVRRSRIDYINSHDELRDIIDELTTGRIGSEPTTETIEAQNKSGLIRYKYRTGPGFADAKSKQDDKFSFNGVNYDAQYSDYYIWMQILKEVKEKNIKKVIYVTNDEKEDFFYKINNKNRGPVESLVTEIKRETNAEIFLMHQIDSFLHHAVKSLDAKIDDSSINELAASAAVGAESVFSGLASDMFSTASGKVELDSFPDFINSIYDESLIQNNETKQLIIYYNQLNSELASVNESIEQLLIESSEKSTIFEKQRMINKSSKYKNQRKLIVSQLNEIKMQLINKRNK